MNDVPIFGCMLLIHNGTFPCYGLYIDHSAFSENGRVVWLLFAHLNNQGTCRCIAQNFDIPPLQWKTMLDNFTLMMKQWNGEDIACFDAREFLSDVVYHE